MVAVYQSAVQYSEYCANLVAVQPPPERVLPQLATDLWQPDSAMQVAELTLGEAVALRQVLDACIGVVRREKPCRLINQPAPAVGLPVQVSAGRSSPSLLIGLRRGLARKCPAFGEGPLFCGYLAVRPVCPACLNDNEQYPSDDFAPYVTIFLVLHLMVPVLVAVDRMWSLSVGLEAALAIPISLATTLLVLPFAKGTVIGFAWAFGVTRNPAVQP